MSLPRWRNVLRYTQGDALEEDAACDGVATVLFRSEAARLAHIADPDGALGRAFGLTVSGFAPRTTFVIGRDGRVARVFPGVRVDGHAAEVLAAVRALPAQR